MNTDDHARIMQTQIAELRAQNVKLRSTFDKPCAQTCKVSSLVRELEVKNDALRAIINEH